MQIRIPGRRLALVAAVVLVGATTAYGASAASKGKVTKVGFASPAKASDYGWNAQGYNAAKAAAKASGASFDPITNIGYDKTDTVLRQLINQGANFIVAHASAEVDALTAAMEELLSRSPEELRLAGESAHARVVERHSVDITAAKLAVLFRQSDQPHTSPT